MNRLEKELAKRGITYKADELAILRYGIEHDNDCSLVFFTKDFIVCKFDSAVVDSVFYIYDTNFNIIGCQLVTKDSMFGWESCTKFFGDDEEDWEALAVEG